MAMYLFGNYNSVPLDTSISSGASSIILSGDYTGESWTEIGDTVRLVEGTNEDILEIDTCTYDGGTDQTTIATVGSTTNSYTTSGYMYSLRDRIKKKVGSLDGDGATASFVCTIDETEEPSEVRSYKSGTSYGELLTKDTDWSWNDAADEVSLSYTPINGETVVAFGPGIWLFGDEFLSEGVQESYTEDIYLYFDTDYDCVYVAPNPLYTSEIDIDWFQIGKEISAGTWEYAANQTFCESVSAGDVLNLRAKIFFPSSSDYNETVRNYYNTSLYLGHLTMPTN